MTSRHDPTEAHDIVDGMYTDRPRRLSRAELAIIARFLDENAHRIGGRRDTLLAMLTFEGYDDARAAVYADLVARIAELRRAA